MAKYTELAEDILAHVGSSENVDGLRHCVAAFAVQSQRRKSGRYRIFATT